MSEKVYLYGDGKPRGNNLAEKVNRIKIVMGGDGGVGKTTLLKVLCGEAFSDQDMTIALDIFTIHFYINDIHEVLQIWDLGGQDHFRFLLSDLFRGAQGVILAFDVSRQNSFLNLPEWISIIKAKAPQAPILLIGTKADLDYHPMLGKKMARDFVRSNNLVDYYEVSTKDNRNIEIPFRRLLEVIRNMSPGTVKPGFKGAIVSIPSQMSKGESTIKKDAPEHPIYLNCPHCNALLRDSQIKLQQAGRQVLCQQCFKMI